MDPADMNITAVKALIRNEVSPHVFPDVAFRNAVSIELA